MAAFKTITHGEIFSNTAATIATNTNCDWAVEMGDATGLTIDVRMTNANIVGQLIVNEGNRLDGTNGVLCDLVELDGTNTPGVVGRFSVASKYAFVRIRRNSGQAEFSGIVHRKPVYVNVS